MPKDPSSPFQRSLRTPGSFTLTFELVPSRGGRSKEHSRTLCLAKEIARDGRIQAVSITENAGGHPTLSPEVLGNEVRDMGLDAIIHLSCKDKNRNQMESILYAWDRIGLRNLLVITGDYPQQGYRGYAKPVFDLGSLHVLDFLERMNQGAHNDEAAADAPPVHRTSFFKGVAISPFKRLEAELMAQYFKLHRKVDSGADYAITQVGFDARKFHEVLLYMRENRLQVPLLGNVFIPNLAVTELMFRGRVPGCVIPPRLYEDIQQEAKAADKGKKARLIRGAKLLSIIKGLGYSGAHIGGPGLGFKDLDFLLSQAEQMADGWQAFIPELSYWLEDGFYYFKKDEDNGLNLPRPEERPAQVRGGPPSYTVSRLLHGLAFEPAAPLYGPMKNACLAMDRGRLRSALTHIEHFLKFLAFNCQNCGDCTLAELAFLCPQSGCAKYLLNGACGGSRDGWCEVYPGRRRCLYVRIYERLRSNGGEESMKKGFIPPRNWSLNKTSSWVNFFRGTDHTGSTLK